MLVLHGVPELGEQIGMPGRYARAQCGLRVRERPHVAPRGPVREHESLGDCPIPDQTLRLGDGAHNVVDTATVQRLIRRATPGSRPAQ